MAKWFEKLFQKKEPTHAQLMQAQQNILADIAANIRILQRLSLTRERVKAIEKLRKLRTMIRDQNEQIRSAQRLRNERTFENPVHHAAMQTSWRMSENQATRLKGAMALEARAIIQKQLHMHALHTRRKKRKATRRA